MNQAQPSASSLARATANAARTRSGAVPPMTRNEAFSAWIMNGSQVTVVVVTIGSRDQKGLVDFRRRLAGLTNKVTSGGPTSLNRALSWYYGEEGPSRF